MNAPVDLTNLRTMTDGDIDMEKALFDEFFSSFESGISVLKASCDTGAEENWRKQSHALKGIALNLGAEALGNLCRNAQDGNMQPAEQKHSMLLSIEAEYFRVKHFISALS